MVRSFIQEVGYLDRYLSRLQCEGYEIISVTPIEEKKYDRESRMYVDRNLFNIIAENKKLKPIRFWCVGDEEFHTRKEAWDYAESKELSPYYHVDECYDYVEVEE